MTTRVALSELSRKGVRYRAVHDGTFTLTATAKIPAGRTLVTDNFLDMAVLAPNVDLLSYELVCNTGLADDAAGTVQVRAYNAATAVPTAEATGLDSTNLVPTAVAFAQSGAGQAISAERTGSNGSGTFIWTPASNGANSDGNFTNTDITPRAYPLSGTQSHTGAYVLAPTAGSRLIRVVFRAVGTQTTAATTNRFVTLTLVCAAGRVNTPVLRPYEYRDVRSNTTLVSS